MLRQIRVFNIVLIGMILFMMGVFVNSKEGFHRDELLSYESANASGTVGRIYEILEDTSVRWISKEDVTRALTVGEDDYSDYSSAMAYSYTDVNPPLYRILLHMFSCLFTGELNKWVGCGLNMCFLLGTLILLVRMCDDVLRHPKLSPYCIALYGFSVGTINGVLVTKPYMMVAFCVMWTLYEFGLFWTRNEERKSGVRLAFAIIIGMWTQFFYTGFLLILAVMFVAGMLLSKRKFELRRFTIHASCAVFVGAAGIFANDWIFNRRNLAASVLWEHLSELDWTLTPWEIAWLYLGNTFGSPWAGLALMFLFVTVGILCIIGRKFNVSKDHYYLPLMLLVPCLVYIYYLTGEASCYSDRYLLSCIPVFQLLLVWGIGKFLDLLPLREQSRMWIMSVSISFLMIPGIIFSTPEYLMQGFGEKEEVAEEYADFRCIYVGEDVYNNMTEMMYFSQTMVVTPQQLQRIPEDARLNESDVVLVMIEDGQENNVIIDYIRTTYMYSSVDGFMEAVDGTQYYYLAR